MHLAGKCGQIMWSLCLMELIRLQFFSVPHGSTY